MDYSLKNFLGLQAYQNRQDFIKYLQQFDNERQIDCLEEHKKDFFKQESRQGLQFDYQLERRQCYHSLILDKQVINKLEINQIEYLFYKQETYIRLDFDLDQENRRETTCLDLGKSLDKQECLPHYTLIPFHYILVSFPRQV